MAAACSVSRATAAAFRESALSVSGISRAWVSFLSSRSGCEYTAAAIAALVQSLRRYGRLMPEALRPVRSAYLRRAAAKEAAFDKPNPSTAVRLFSGRSWLVGVSDAPRKLRGRLHRLADAAQALAKGLFGLLKVVFALYLGCCQTTKASLGAATKKPRKSCPRTATQNTQPSTEK